MFFWDTIFSTDVTSVEGLSNIAALVRSQSKIKAARSLCGDQAQGFIDQIDRVSDPIKHLSASRVFIMRYSSSRYRNSTGNCLGGAHDCFTRSAKPARYYPPRILSNQNSPTLVSLGGAAASRTLAKENMEGAPWQSNI